MNEFPIENRRQTSVGREEIAEAEVAVNNDRGGRGVQGLGAAAKQLTPRRKVGWGVGKASREQFHFVGVAAGIAEVLEFEKSFRRDSMNLCECASATELNVGAERRIRLDQSKYATGDRFALDVLRDDRARRGIGNENSRNEDACVFGGAKSLASFSIE